MKKQEPLPSNGLRGDDYKEMRDDLLAIRGVQTGTETATKVTTARVEVKPEPPAPDQPKVNLPLAKSDNEAVRSLANLHEQGAIDEANMPPAAARYLADRPWMTPELLEKWQVAYLPKSVKSILKNRWTYPVKNIRGDVLWWQGRDPEYEQKFAKWDADGRPAKGKPIKHKMPATVHRGSELFGQHASRLSEPGYREFIARHGIILAEGFNDVLRFDQAGAVVLSMMGKVVTDVQATLAWKFAHKLGNGKLSVMCDNNDEGVDGAMRSIAKLSVHGPVLNVWSPNTFDGRFANKEPEHLSDEEVSHLIASIASRWDSVSRKK